MSDAAKFSPVMQSPMHHFNLPGRQVAADASQGVWANEMPLLGYISVRGNSADPEFSQAFERATGIAIVRKPCGIQHAEWGSVLWLAPDEWLLICQRSARDGLLGKLQSSLRDIHAQVVDNSGGYTTVALHGTHASAALQHCTVYDVAALTPQRAVGSTFGKASAILLRRDDAYFLVFRRSFADYIWQYLERSAAPYGFGVSQLGLDQH